LPAPAGPDQNRFSFAPEAAKRHMQSEGIFELKMLFGVVRDLSMAQTYHSEQSDD
jgi:hypothetical protein